VQRIIEICIGFSGIVRCESSILRLSAIIVCMCVLVVASLNLCCSEHHSALWNIIVGGFWSILVACVIAIVRMRLCTPGEIQWIACSLLTLGNVSNATLEDTYGLKMSLYLSIDSINT
jgi:hypothetical protein